DKGASALSFSVSGQPLNASVQGDATFGDKMTFVGDTKLDVPSVRKLGAWLGSPISGDKGFGPMTVSGKMNYTSDNFSFDNADLKFDAIHATGAFKTTLGAKIPLVTASLATDSLDLRPYISESKAAAGTEKTAPAPASWSTDPIDASALKGFDADLNFVAGKILVRDLTLDKSALALVVKSGVLTVDLKQLALYNGAGKGTITLDANNRNLQLAANLSLSGVDGARFLKDFMKTDRISGTGSFNVNVHGSGLSQRDIVSSLGGNAAINFANGALKGIDLVKIANIANAFLGKKGVDPNQASTQTDQAQTSGDSTRFVAMGGTFAISSGIATTSDFKLINDLISLSAMGSINLPQQSIDFRVAPGKNQSDGGLKVGLIVKGPLAKPKFIPDVSGLIQNELNKALGKLLGGSKSQMNDGSGDTAATKPNSAQQLLQGLFGGQH
ncbi:MAG: AsmA family protein, partial [Alphaproteobacteria bacterium]